MPPTSHPIDQDVARRIKEAREATGLGLKKIAFRIWRDYPEDLHISDSKLSRIENGLSPVNTFELAILADIYGVTMADLDPAGVERSMEALARVTSTINPSGEALPEVRSKGAQSRCFSRNAQRGATAELITT